MLEQPLPHIHVLRLARRHHQVLPAGFARRGERASALHLDARVVRVAGGHEGDEGPGEVDDLHGPAPCRRVVKTRRVHSSPRATDPLDWLSTRRRGNRPERESPLHPPFGGGCWYYHCIARATHACVQTNKGARLVAKILVVEDQGNIRKLVRINLERAGHTVVEAGGKEEGLALAESEQPDLICLDVMMPKGT
ncbi:MAG: response regulator, partial [Armatimonadetes bacterium]|nr:response regulator [Armatimonadota bacterium]